MSLGTDHFFFTTAALCSQPPSCLDYQAIAVTESKHAVAADKSEEAIIVDITDTLLHLTELLILLNYSLNICYS